jgi:hypothetical protein
MAPTAKSTIKASGSLHVPMFNKFLPATRVVPRMKGTQ